MLLALPQGLSVGRGKATDRMFFDLGFCAVIAVPDVPLFPMRGEQLEEEEEVEVTNTICNVGMIICK